MKILIIDNTIDLPFWGSKDLCRLARLHSGATVYTRRAPQEDLPPDPEAFDRIIVSGSKTSSLEDAPWIEKLITFIRRAVDLKKPFLGICYGHQVLARALGGKEILRIAAKPEFGWTQIKLTETFPLAKNLPQTFYSFSSHFEEICQLPNGMKNFAFSADCQIQACQLEELPIFGLQFHPEKEVSGTLSLIKEMKKEGVPILHEGRSNELYNPQVGETLFRNFLEL